MNAIINYLYFWASKVLPTRKWRTKARTQLSLMSPIEAYSQEGEDLVLNRIFGEQATGYYVDVGAHHPFRFSNTAIFYKKGWCGINIDPLPGSKFCFPRETE